MSIYHASFHVRHQAVYVLLAFIVAPKAADFLQPYSLHSRVIVAFFYDGTACRPCIKQALAFSVYHLNTTLPHSISVPSLQLSH